MKKYSTPPRPWYENGDWPGRRMPLGRKTIARLAADQEGRALLESYARMYHGF